MTDKTTEQVHSKANQWLGSPVIDEGTKAEIRALLTKPDNTELIDRFYKDLEFGTGGLRGVMGVGSNCMNKYTVGIATQGLCNYLNKALSGKSIKVAIAYDNRNNSAYFAKIAAGVFSANGISVFIFPELRPTPVLSYAIRHLGCDSGIVVTASHNPKEYNGYKAYWADGAQVVPPHDKNIIQEVNALTSFEQVKFEANEGLIHQIKPEVEDAYYRQVKDLLNWVVSPKDIPIVFSGLHGTGNTMVPECLRRLGFGNVIEVKEQSMPDGNFSTVHSPNPEEEVAMGMALEYARAHQAELVLATDPDADRVGVGIRDNNGKFFLLNGNQAFSLLVWFILKNMKDRANTYIAKTIVTTELVDTICSAYQVECLNTLTGFKYIAELIRSRENSSRFIAAGEESYGYMVGDFVRDKDAVSACAFFASMSATAKSEGKTLYDWLLQMYSEHGLYREGLVNLTKKGQKGEDEIRSMMNRFRNDPPASIAGSDVVRILDFETLTERDVITNTVKPLDFTRSNVLQYYLKDGSKISVRPSGTEPKIKFYFSVNSPLSDPDRYQAVNSSLEDRIKEIAKDMGL